MPRFCQTDGATEPNEELHAQFSLKGLICVVTFSVCTPRTHSAVRVSSAFRGRDAEDSQVPNFHRIYLSLALSI